MLYLPSHIPCAEILQSKGHSVCETPLGSRREGTRRVLLLNLMPEKAACELQLGRMIAPVADSVDIQVVPVKIPGQTYKTTPMSHMEAFYEDICPATFEQLGGPNTLLIITGAPLEDVAYEAVRYWHELGTIMDWAAQGGVVRTLNLCWAAFAALWWFEKVPTYHLPEKRFGVFSQQVTDCAELSGMGQNFPMPTSRHIELKEQDIACNPRLQIVANSAESGPGIIIDKGRHMTNIVGHLEYEAGRLHFEYQRDISKGKVIHPAQHYYIADSPDRDNLIYSWRDDALQFYRNFLIQ